VSSLVKKITHTHTHTHTHACTHTLPAGLADGLDVDSHGHALQRPLLAAVPRRDLDLVALLPVVAQLLRVPDVS